MENDYKPIACAFYEQLETAAHKKLLNTIKYTEENGEEVVVHDFISDLESYKGAEYLVLKDNGSIRLDKITNFNGLTPKS